MAIPLLSITSTASDDFVVQANLNLSMFLVTATPSLHLYMAMPSDLWDMDNDTFNLLMDLIMSAHKATPTQATLVTSGYALGTHGRNCATRCTVMTSGVSWTAIYTQVQSDHTRDIRDQELTDIQEADHDYIKTLYSIIQDSSCNTTAETLCTIQELFMLTCPEYMTYMPSDSSYDPGIHHLTADGLDCLRKANVQLYFAIPYPGFLNMQSILGSVHNACVITHRNQAPSNQPSRELIVYPLCSFYSTNNSNFTSHYLVVHTSVRQVCRFCFGYCSFFFNQIKSTCVCATRNPWPQWDLTSHLITLGTPFLADRPP